MQFTVSLTSQSSAPVTVNYTITPGTALAGTDYTPPTGGQGTITFAPQQTTATISVPILPDANVAPRPQFTVNITTDSNAQTFNGINAATGTILTDGSFAGVVYVDTNNDGVQQSGEHALPGVTVTVTGTTTLGQTENLTTTSAANGSFSFANLPPGTYTATQTTPANYIEGRATPGAGATASGTQQLTFTITSGDTLTSNDFAERGLQPQLITKRIQLSSVIH